VYETDEEQIDAIKKWFSQWGNYLIAGVLLVVVGYGGYWFYGAQQEQKALAASDQYQRVLSLVNNQTALGAAEQAQLDELFAVLSEDFSDATYAVYTALFQARFAVNDEDYESAQERLQWALENASDAPLKGLINLRLARLELALGLADAVLNRLDSVPAAGQEVGYAELRGDVHAAAGRRDEARDAYAEAWSLVQQQGLQRPLLAVKAENYGAL
jgi:predicted negative regulator of RcsB-dependent stress response